MGNVYVADYWDDHIQKFTSTGTFLTKWGSQGSGDGQFNSPRDVAVDSVGNVYVADTWNHRIQKFNSAGIFLAKWGSQGSGNGQFDVPIGISVDSYGSVYVTENENHRIQKFTSDGVFLIKWGSYGSGDGRFNQPTGITVDSSGNVFVADWANHRIQKFTSTGTFLTKWGSYGSGNGQFNYPQGVAVDSYGNVYVVETWGYRIQKFAESATACWSTTSLSNAELADLVIQHFPDGSVPQTGENIRVTAYAVARAESGGNPTACGDNDQSIGIWQINMPAHPQYTKEWLFNPDNNAEAAMAISSSGQDWNPWCTWESTACGGQGNEAYKAYLDEARSALGISPPASPLKVCIDPGHGGTDPGAVGWDGDPYPNEKDFTLDIALRLKSLLESEGIQVVMTRDADTDVDHQTRCDIANNNGCDIFVSIHCNSASQSAHGTETFYYDHLDIPNPEVGEAGYELAHNIQEELVAEIGLADRGTKGDWEWCIDEYGNHYHLYVLGYTEMPAALTEVAFISNPSEFSLLSDSSFRQSAAQGIANGIIASWFNTPSGSDVTVTLPGAIVTFVNVTSAGTTSVTKSTGNPGGTLPSGYQPIGSFSDISTTATYSGPVTVGIQYNDSGIGNENNLELFHWGSSWNNVTTDRDTVNNIIYGQVTTLSPFFIGESAGTEPTPEGGCFIATAAYGSYLDSHVQTLRNFRDQYLVTNPVGSAIVSTYYKLSPPVAEFIDDHPALKPMVRVGLLPAVAISTVAVSTTLAEKLAIVSVLLLVSSLVVVWTKRKAVSGKP